MMTCSGGQYTSGPPSHLHKALLELHLLLDVLAETLVHLVGVHEVVHPLGTPVVADDVGGLPVLNMSALATVNLTMFKDYKFQSYSLFVD